MNSLNSQNHENHETLDQIWDILDPNREYHRTIYQIIIILLKPPKKRNQLDINFIESFCA